MTDNNQLKAQFEDYLAKLKHELYYPYLHDRDKAIHNRLTYVRQVKINLVEKEEVKDSYLQKAYLALLQQQEEEINEKQIKP